MLKVNMRNVRSLVLSECILAENDGITKKFSNAFKTFKDVSISLYRNLLIDSKSISTIWFLYELIIAFLKAL